MLNKEDYKICIVGLGYVGLPLAARFAMKGFNIIGFDIKEERVNQLIEQIDVNEDIDNDSLNYLSKNSLLTSNIDQLTGCNIFIVKVPTPINDDKTPDLKTLIASSKVVGRLIQEGSMVIYESTVYPGVTDEVCTPILEEESNLVFNIDFSTGYSPERVVPGDDNNTIEKITKVVSASNKKALKIATFLYSSIIDAGIHQASSIKVAEASKVTENIQRDVNIALINEFHQLYSALGINTHEVIEAASTKWNFMKLNPGLVGGHCISIDPYYLMHKSEISGYEPNIMRAARKLNNEMDDWVVQNFQDYVKTLNLNLNEINVTFLGYTFKENCNDTRNTKVKDLILKIKNLGCKIEVWDPLIDDSEVKKILAFGIPVIKKEPQSIEFAFLCVAHNEIVEYLKKYDGHLYDYKNLHFK